ncbi:MAG: uracil-DNA glycosylase [Nocardioidaceae bacterium]|nr:uracil-DNA glycosylase [Nocardioidaceae bacterium]
MTARPQEPTRHPHPLSGAPFSSPVPPGSGWPGDPATPATPVAADAEGVLARATALTTLAELDAEVSVCRACPRLVDWRESVAVEKRRSFADEPYWGRPIHGWGSERPAVIIVGLAPAAHGGNRTGRIFTGDRSGDWLFASLHRVGLAAAPTSVHAGDGQRLVNTRMVAAVRCAPPANRPTPYERDTCAPWLDAELALVLATVRAVVCLGAFAWDAALRALARQGCAVPRPRPGFGHGAQVELPRPAGATDLVPAPMVVLASYHPSQQNTFTGTLTAPMLDDVLATAAHLAGS